MIMIIIIITTSGTCVPRLIQKTEGAFEAGVTCNIEVALERKWGCHTLRCVYQGPPGSLRRPDLDTSPGLWVLCVCVCDVCFVWCVLFVCCRCCVCVCVRFVWGVMCWAWFVSLCACSSEAPGGPRRPQAASGGPRRPQEASGGPKRLQEAAGGPRRPQEVSGHPQEAPRRGLGCQKVQKAQEAPGGSRRPPGGSEAGSGARFWKDFSSETAIPWESGSQLLKLPCVFEGFMLTCWISHVFLDPDVAICVRGATDFQNFEDVPSETPRKIADACALIASELYSLGEVRMIVYIYICLYTP